MKGDSPESSLRKAIPIRPAEGCPLLTKGVGEAAARVQCGYRNAFSGLNRKLKVRSNSAKTLLSERAVTRKVESILSTLDHIDRVQDLFDCLFEHIPERFDCRDVKYHFVNGTAHPQREGGKDTEDLSNLFFDSLRSYDLIRKAERGADAQSETRYEIHPGAYAMKEEHRYVPIIIENALSHPDRTRVDVLVGYVEIPVTEENRGNLKRSNTIVKQVMRNVRSHLDRIRDALKNREDFLSKLYNRRGFYDLAWDLLDKRPADRHSIITLDLDFFRDVNENYGHGGGDDAIRFVGDRIREVASEYEGIVPSRFGGEEFVIYVRDKGDGEVFHIAEKMRLAIAEGTVASGDERFNITASFGIARASESDLEWNSVIARADAALYRAKAEGRNRTVAFDSGSDTGKQVENPGEGGTFRKN